MKPASLSQKSNDAQKYNTSEKVKKTSNNFTELSLFKEIDEYSWNKQLIENNEAGIPYSLRCMELELKNEHGDQIHELQMSHYLEIKSLEMQILEMNKNYEHCLKEKNSMKSDNTFLSVFSMLLVTLGGLLVSSNSIGWIVIIIGFLLLLKDKIVNSRILK